MHANYASNNRKRDNVKIIRIALDLRDREDLFKILIVTAEN